MKRFKTILTCSLACLSLAMSANTSSNVFSAKVNDTPNVAPETTKYSAEYIKTRLQLIYALAFNSLETGRPNVSSYFFTEEFRSAYRTARQLTPEGETGYYDFSPWLRTQNCKGPRAEIQNVHDITANSAMADVRIFPYEGNDQGISVMVRLRFEAGDWFVADFNNDLEGLHDYISRHN